MPSADHAQFERDSTGETGYLSTTFGCVPTCLAVAVWRKHDSGLYPDDRSHPHRIYGLPFEPSCPRL